jgi:hypothetical protein
MLLVHEISEEDPASHRLPGDAVTVAGGSNLKTSNFADGLLLIAFNLAAT